MNFWMDGLADEWMGGWADGWIETVCNVGEGTLHISKQNEKQKI
jgi:hypothetical protein